MESRKMRNNLRRNAQQKSEEHKMTGKKLLKTHKKIMENVD